MAEAFEELSARECEILALVATGITNQQIARDLGISVNTVKAHLRRIFGKLGVESRTEATTCAIQMGLIRVTPTGAERILPGDEEGDGQAPEDLPSGAEGEPVAHPPAPFFSRPVVWRVPAPQVAVLIVCAALALAVAIWPTPRPAASQAPSRFVDLPATAPAGGAESREGRWMQRASMPTARSRFAQVALAGAIYAIGGLAEEGWTGAVERYDVAADTWTTHTPKPVPVANVGAAAVGGRIYVPGGYDEASAARDILEVYDPVADAWSTAAPLPQPLFAYAIAPYGEGFYLFGGHDGTDYVDTVYHYDAAADAWSLAGSLGVARGFAAAATVEAGGEAAIYLLGGYDGQTEYALCESFHPARAATGEDPWEAHAPASLGRAGHGLVASGGKLYAVGGGWDGALLYNERYDIALDVWSSFESPLVGEWRTLGLSSASGTDGTRLYAIGGWAGRPLNGVEIYQAEYRLYVP
jgi:DNA-binding CsgD family transcriptional regulator